MHSLYESNIFMQHTVKRKKIRIYIYSNTVALKCNKLLLNTNKTYGGSQIMTSQQALQSASAKGNRRFQSAFHCFFFFAFFTLKNIILFANLVH